MKKIKELNIERYFNPNYPIKVNLICVAIGITLFFICNWIFKNAYRSEFFSNQEATLANLAFLGYFGVVIILIPFNFKEKLIKILAVFVFLLVAIYTMSNNENTMQLFMAGSILILAIITVLIIRPFIVFAMALCYLYCGLLLLLILFKLGVGGDYAFVLMFGVCVLAMALFRITGIRVCNYIGKRLFTHVIIDEGNKKSDVEKLRNYVYLAYFCGYMVYYFYLYSNNQISDTNSIFINSLLITVVAMYQIDWDSIWEDIKLGNKHNYEMLMKARIKMKEKEVKVESETKKEGK